MRRRHFLAGTAGAGLAVAQLPHAALAAQDSGTIHGSEDPKSHASKLTPPAKGKMPVAFVISKYVTVIDFCGPWEVFGDVHVPERGSTMDEMMPFELYTVSGSTEPVRASGGLTIVPDFTFETAPEPKVVVVPAQGGAGEPALAWLRKTSGTADVTMSVCTGAFVLGRAGLLDGRSATTHHDYLDKLAETFPKVDVKRGLRFVEGDRISTAGGLTSGIDLALRVVDRYFGRKVAARTAEYMEYQSTGWML
ncbi:MAG TPA: DJ-1/PfpI family protein [Candidatus Saccharimonadales bacterium]|nr:DJ-1/PfpI family protein [Candidatus Saccharimonadales bacterium]